MRAPLTEREGRQPGYLATCPACSALNGVNATACWRCEKPLPGAADEMGEDASAQAERDAQESAAAPAAPASFFSVLREELGEQAANDGPAAESSAPDGGEAVAPGSSWARRVAARPLWALAVLIPVVVAVAALWWGSGPRSAPSSVRDSRPSTAPAPVAARPDAPAPVAVSPPPAAPTLWREGAAPRTPRPAGARAAVMAPAGAPVERTTGLPDSPPPPVNAPCTPQVAALGLCTPASD